MMKQLQGPERPRERCLQHGPENLSLRECLAVLLGSGPRAVGCLGVAAQILGNTHAPDDDLQQVEQLVQERSFEGICGLGDAGRARLMVCFEIAKRFANARECRRQIVLEATKANDPIETRALKRIPWRERFQAREWIGYVPILSDRTLGAFCIAERGMQTRVNFDPQHFFKLVLSAPRTVGFFLFHNHPSGCLEASQDDVNLTAELVKVCGHLNLHFAGHWVVAGARERRIEWDC